MIHTRQASTSLHVQSTLTCALPFQCTICCLYSHVLCVEAFCQCRRLLLFLSFFVGVVPTARSFEKRQSAANINDIKFTCFVRSNKIENRKKLPT